jgi:RNA polymerase sigma factor (sigma-70 family)
MTLHHHVRPAADALDAAQRERVAGPRRRRAGFGGMLEAASRGDAAAWESLIERFGPRLCAIVRTYRLPAHVTDDVLQTTWLRLLEHGDSIRNPAALGAWLETIARRECLRHLQAGRREQATGDDMLEPEPAHAVDVANLVAREHRTAIQRALAALPRHQRRLLALLFALEEPSYETISSRLDMPIGSIGPTRARSLERLRQDEALIAAVASDPSGI